MADHGHDPRGDRPGASGPGATVRAAIGLHAEEEAGGGRARAPPEDRGGDGTGEEEARGGGGPSQAGRRRPAPVSEGSFTANSGAS